MGDRPARQVSMDTIVQLLNRYIATVLDSGEGSDDGGEFVIPNAHDADSDTDLDSEQSDEEDADMKRKRASSVVRLGDAPIVQDILLQSGAYTQPRARARSSPPAYTAQQQQNAPDDTARVPEAPKSAKRRRASDARAPPDHGAGGSAEGESEVPCAKRAKGNLFSMLRFRERNAFAIGGALSRGQRTRVTHRMLPNTPAGLVDSYQYKAFCGRYSSDGTIFMTACQDHNIRLYDATSNFRPLRTIGAKRLGWSIVDTDYSPDQQYVVYSGWAPSIYLCNVAGGSEIHEALRLQQESYHSFCPFTVRFSHDSRHIVAGANDHCIYLYDLAESRRKLRVEAHSDDVNAVAFADNSSNVIYSGSDDALIKVWDLRTLNEDRPMPAGYLEGHTMGITYIDSKGDGRYLLSNGKDQAMRLWDIRSMTSCAGKPPRSASMFDYRHGDADRASALSSMSRVRDASVAKFTGHKVLYTLIRCRFSPADSTGQMYAYTGSACGAVHVFDILTGELVARLAAHISAT